MGHPVFCPSGDLVEYVGTVIDVTERKRAEALRDGESRLDWLPFTQADKGGLYLNFTR